MLDLPHNLLRLLHQPIWEVSVLLLQLLLRDLNLFPTPVPYDHLQATEDKKRQQINFTQIGSKTLNTRKEHMHALP